MGYLNALILFSPLLWNMAKNYKTSYYQSTQRQSLKEIMNRMEQKRI